MAIALLHTNDAHGTLREDVFERLRTLREAADLYFDTGDVIKTGNLGIPLKREPVWDLLDTLRCNASVLGNRETHISEAAFNAKIAGAKHPLLAANLHRKDGSHPLPESAHFEVHGLKVGVFGVMVPMVTSRMATQVASAFLWDPPLEVAARMATAMRAECDLLIALTHIGNREDRLLAERVPEIDIILGGHSHTILDQPERVGRTWICQGGSHSRFAGVYRWEDGELSGGLVGIRE